MLLVKTVSDNQIKSTIYKSRPSSRLPGIRNRKLTSLKFIFPLLVIGVGPYAPLPLPQSPGVKCPLLTKSRPRDSFLKLYTH